ncbi:MAG: carboxypeptidase regulatory-like domain-containing protein [Novosphingobium sp.]
MRGLTFLIGKAAALGAAALAVWSAPLHADTWRANEDDALLLELHSGQYKIGDTLRGYQTPQGVCVDFADLVQALDLPMRVDTKSRRATGWLFAEDQHLTIDRDSNTVQNVNGSRTIASGAISDTPEGWCIDLDALSNWMGVRLKSDLGSMSIRLESDKKLPFLEAIERKSRAARLRAPRDAQFDLASLPHADAAYRTWRTPSVDVQVQAQWSGRSGTQVQYEALASGEVVGLSYTARLAGTNGLAPDSLRIKLYRNDPDGGLLGPLRATRFAIGDVDTESTALTAQSAYGRGLFVSNRPLNLPSRFGTTTLRGILPAGWDAELYRNGELRAFQSDRGDGRYEFNDIELVFGDNEFDVVLYGPQGQVRHERSTMPVGLENLPAGKTWYWAGVVDQGHDLIGNARGSSDPMNGWRWGVGIEHGIDRRTTIGAAYTSSMMLGRRRNYLEGTLRRAMGPVLVELSGAQQLGAGRALRGEALGKLGSWRFAGHLLWVDGTFDSEQVNARQRSEAELRLNGHLRLGGWSLPVEVAARQNRTRDGVKITELLTQGSLRISRATLTVQLLHRSASGDAAQIATEAQGNSIAVLGNAGFGRVRLRGQARFGLDGNQPGFQQAQVVVETPVGRDTTARAAYDIDAASDRRTASLGFVHQFPRFALRGEGTLDNHGNLGFGLTLALSLGPDPAGGGWRVSREKLAQQGQASIEVFRDDNGDGLKQDREPAVEGVAIEAGFKHSDKPTNKAGRAVIDGLLPYVPVLVSIDAGSLPDPLLRPKGQGMVVVPRPGVAAKVLLPLAPTGEIEAVLLGPDGEPQGGVTVELTDPSGHVLFQTVSDFDGYVLFDSVPYGDYRLRIGADSAAALGVLNAARPLRIDQAHASQQLGRIRLQPRTPPLAQGP